MTDLKAAPPPTFRHVRSNDGVRLAVDDMGDPAAPAIVLLHGGGQTRHSWSGTMRKLATAGYRVLNYDARGHGESDWSPEGAYAIDDRVQDLSAVVADCRAPFAVVGASLGGATALRAAALGLPAAAIVLVDIVPHPETHGVSRIVEFMRANLDGFSSLEEAADAVAGYNPSRPRPRDPSGLLRNLRERDGKFFWHWDPLTVGGGKQSDFNREIEEAARIVANDTNIPLMVVRGLSSDVVSDAGIAAFRKMAPRLEVSDVRGAGHMVAGDRNDLFMDGVFGFLERHLPRP